MATAKLSGKGYKEMIFRKTVSFIMISLIICSLGCFKKEQDISAPNCLYVPEQDNGVAGIGTMRGNTNGNLQNGGLAVCDGTLLYFVDYDYTQDKSAINQINLESQERSVLLDNIQGHVSQINYYNNDLFFVCNSPENEALNCVMLYSPETQTSKELLQQEHITMLQTVYQRIIVSAVTGSESAVYLYKLDGAYVGKIDSFLLYGAMDGLLYGIHEDVTSTVFSAVDAEGNCVETYPVEVAIPINGYLIHVNNALNHEDYLDYTGRVEIIDATNGQITYIPITQFPCSSYYNASTNFIYIKQYGYDETGVVYRMDWEGKELAQVSNIVFDEGFSLWNDIIITNSFS